MSVLSRLCYSQCLARTPLGLLKDNDEDITIFQGNRYPQLRSAKLPLQSESDDLKGGNNAGKNWVIEKETEE